MYKSFPVQNCAIWLAKALASLYRVLKVLSVVLHVRNVSVGLWSIALEEPISNDPLVKNSYSSFSLLQSLSNSSQFYTTGVLVDTDSIIHCSLIMCQLFLSLFGGQTMYAHPWLDVGGDEARSSGTCFDASPETGRPTLQLNTTYSLPAQDFRYACGCPSIRFVREIGLSFPSGASSWGPWWREASFSLCFYCKHSRRCRRAPEGRPRCTWGGRERERLDIFKRQQKWSGLKRFVR